ncbi:MAG: hypothetical protein HFP77_05980 [Methylococcales symbiont of Iophon sp. n. MRB-2018]|nr:MAG: hypothetical protein HFP77_05980 [Methylococcales symbiont of Iophon sp. n. MRB-2018]KAF3979221.1 MAG: hypothetical protein HFP76_08075 [Methylococcales symbiont of Iophon sp. n. MRB-2018]
MKKFKALILFVIAFAFAKLMGEIISQNTLIDDGVIDKLYYARAINNALPQLSLAIVLLIVYLITLVLKSLREKGNSKSHSQLQEMESTSNTTEQIQNSKTIENKFRLRKKCHWLVSV